MNKYLLCRPMGGLNDILCRIENCLQYASKNKRILILDTNHSGLLDNIEKYFDFNHYKNRIIFTSDISDDFFSGKTIFPFSDHELLKFPPKWSMEHRKWVCSKSNVVIDFSFDKEYEQDIIVFQQPGGGLLSVDLIRNLKFTDAVNDFISEKIKNIPNNYSAIHVRNSDYKTDFIGFFERIKESIKNGTNLLICSDDLGCIQFAKNFFSENVNIFSIAEIPDTGGKPLHMNRELDRYSTNLNCLLDLYALANAETLYTTNVTKGFPSGFTRLASALNKEKAILKNLMGINKK